MASTDKDKESKVADLTVLTVDAAQNLPGRVIKVCGQCACAYVRDWCIVLCVVLCVMRV